MTKITMQSDNGCYFVKAEGHAMGSPAVCAAVSGILYALAGYLSNSKCNVKKLELLDGFAEFEFYGAADAEAVYLMTVIGLSQIEKAYPEYIAVELTNNL